MRWIDAYIGLMAATLGFGALVTGIEGGWPYAVPFGVMAVGALGLMTLRNVRTSKVVLVGNPGSAPVVSLRAELDEAGFGSRPCPGPERRPCPALEGRACPLGDHPVAAVVFRSATASAPDPPCGQALGVPALRVEEADGHTMIAAGREARMGWAFGAPVVVESLKALLARDAAAAR